MAAGNNSVEVSRAVAVQAKGWEVFLGFVWDQVLGRLVALAVFETQLTEAPFDAENVLTGRPLCVDVFLEQLELLLCDGFELGSEFSGQVAVFGDELVGSSAETHITVFFNGA